MKKSFFTLLFFLSRMKWMLLHLKLQLCIVIAPFGGFQLDYFCNFQGFSEESLLDWTTKISLNLDSILATLTPKVAKEAVFNRLHTRIRYMIKNILLTASYAQRS